jgi:L-iditol 2-dehydrogenase
MKAVVKTTPGVGNVELREIAEPEVSAGQVKIAVRAAGICGTDLHILRDEYRSWPPVVMGHEVSGQVVEVGAGVERIAPGDRVTTETYFSTCGSCRFCREGRINLCPDRRSIGSAVNGGFTSYLIVPERNVHRLPDSVDFLAGALTEPLACVVHGALELPRLTPGDTAVIAGPGAIGLLALQVVLAAGVRVVMLGTDRDEQRLAMARELGAAEAFNIQRDGYEEAILEMTGGLGTDIVYECSGAGPAAQMLLQVVRRGGQYAQIGLFGKSVAWDLDQICYRELQVTGSNASVPSSWNRALRLLSAGTVVTAPLISGVYAVSDWRAAFDTFENRSGLKTVLQPEEVSA